MQQPAAKTQGPQQATAAEAGAVAAGQPSLLLEVVEDRAASPEPVQASEQTASLLEAFEDRGPSPVHVAPRTNLPQVILVAGLYPSISMLVLCSLCQSLMSARETEQGA